MTRDNVHSSADAFAAAMQRQAREKIDLRLYVLGASCRSATVIARVMDICERYLADRYDLKVIDLYQHPELARADQIIAAPTLLKAAPAPLRRMVGDLSKLDLVLHALGIAV
jgi:circadian clock protein KaiB